MTFYLDIWLAERWVSLAPLHSQFENLAFYISFMKAFEVFEHMKPSTWRHLILEDFKFFEQVFTLTASRVFQTSGLHQNFKSSWRLPCLRRLNSEGLKLLEKKLTQFHGNYGCRKILGIEPIHRSWRFVITLPRGFNRYFLY